MRKWLVFTSKSDVDSIVSQIDSSLNYTAPETCSIVYEENVELNKRYCIKLTQDAQQTLSAEEQANLIIFPNDFIFVTE